jgi:hypothetical protein
LRELTDGKLYPPAIVWRQRGISDSAKRTYEVLYKRAGQNDCVWPSQKTIAYDLGKSVRQVRYNLRALRAKGLIQWGWKGGRYSNTYRFLWHEMFECQSIFTQAKERDSQQQRFA